jgi:hypothetical protein
MWYYIIKVLSSSAIIVLITEISKKNSFWGSVLASIPLISLLAFLWIYIDTKDIKKISELSTGIFLISVSAEKKLEFLSCPDNFIVNHGHPLFRNGLCT